MGLLYRNSFGQVRVDRNLLIRFSALVFVLSFLSLGITSTAYAAVQVSISPTSTSAISGATTTFTATVQNASNTAVTWSSGLGTISSSGIYTALSVLGTSTLTDTITATSVQDNTKSATATVNVSSGLGLYWNFEEGSGSSTIDQSGDGNTGTWTGTQIGSDGTYYTGGEVGTFAGDFDGSTDSVSRTSGVVNIPANNAPQSISFWVMAPSIPTSSYHVMFELSSNSSGNSAVDIGWNGSPEKLMVWKYGGVPLAQTSTPSAGVWHHVAYTYDGTTNELYVDGSMVASSTVAPNTATPSHIYIGCSAGCFTGFIDDLSVYDRTLSAAEIQAIYSAVASSSIAISTSTPLNFSAAHGSTSTSSQTITIGNTATSSSLSWSATSTQSWLTFSPSSSSLAAGASTTVALIVNPTGLGVGSYNATATIFDPNTYPRTLSISLAVTSTGISTTIITPSNGATVSSTISLSATASSTVGIASVQFYLDGGTLGSLITSTSSPNTYTYSWNTTSLTTASHTLYALATDNNGNTVTSSAINVTGTLPPAILSVTTSTSLSFTAIQGSITTSSQSMTIGNTAPSSTMLNWSASSTEPWLTFSLASSSLVGSTNQSVSLIANPTGLGLGIYNATATISDPNATSSPQTLAVTLTVNSIISGYPILNVERTFPSTTSTGMVNVKTYGATGNGVTDDTAAIQSAISHNIHGASSTGNGTILYFPAGTYLVSNPLLWHNLSSAWSSGLTLQGENEENTIIKLTDNNASYQSSSSSTDVIDMGSQDPLNNNGGGNDGFDNYIFDMTIDVGKGNPGATALDFMGNNYCGLRNVTLRSSDPNHVGTVGLSMLRYATGPCLMKNVVINGFNYGIENGQIDYSTTYEDLTLLNQSLYGIDNNGNVMSIRGLSSQDSVPAIYNQSSLGLVTLLQASLQGGSASTSAIVNDGTLYVRNVSSTGYLSAIQNGTSTVPGATVNEYDSGPEKGLFSSATSSLNLPIQETPLFEDTNLADWANVVTYGADPTGATDSSAAIQSTMNSGATTAYFPTGTYKVSQTIHVSGAVRMIDGFDSYITPPNTAFQNASSPTPLFEFDAGSSTVTLNHIQLGNWGSYPYPGIIFIEQNSSRPVVLLDSAYLSIGTQATAAYQNTGSGTGQLFVEDVSAAPWQILYPQNVFARQINPEGSFTKILNNGGTLWILGYKAEGAQTEIETDNSGSTEMLGGYFYPATNVPTNESAFVINNSRASLEYAVTSYGAPSSNPYPNFQTQVTETQNGTMRSLATTATLTRGYGSMTPLYTDMNLSVVSTTVTFPTSGATVSSTINLSAIATSTVGVTSVQFYLDGSPIGPAATSSPYTVSWNSTGASNGSHTLYAAATDNNGNTVNSSNVSITVDNQPPSVSLLSPTGGSISGNSVTLTASSTDLLSGVSSIAFYLDGSTLIGTGSLLVPPLYTYVWDTTQVSNGTHTITALATDGVGNATSSQGISVTINNNPGPAPIIVTGGSSGGGGGGGGGYDAPVPSESTSTSASASTTSSTSSLPATQAGLEALLVSLQSKLKSLLSEAASQNITIPGEASSSFTFTRNLTIGSTGTDVAALEHFLNTHGFPVVSIPGYAGSLGYETPHFGVKTQASLAEFQKSVGIPGTGYFGPATRAYVNGHD